MGMKPRLEQPNKKLDPALVSEPHEVDELNPNIPNTVSTMKVVNNGCLDKNLVSEPHKP